MNILQETCGFIIQNKTNNKIYDLSEFVEDDPDRVNIEKR